LIKSRIATSNFLLSYSNKADNNEEIDKFKSETQKNTPKITLDRISATHILYTYMLASEYINYGENPLHWSSKAKTWKNLKSQVVDFEMVITLDTEDLSKFIKENVWVNRKEVFNNFELVDQNGTTYNRIINDMTKNYQMDTIQASLCKHRYSWEIHFVPFNPSCMYVKAN